MGRYCVVPGCNTTSKSGVMMHRFRRNKGEFLEKWLHAIRRTDLINDLPRLLQRHICDLHFSDKQKFACTSRNRTNLLYDAVPDSNLPDESTVEWRDSKKFNASTEGIMNLPDESTVDWRNIQKLSTFTHKVTDFLEESTNWNSLIEETLLLWPSLVDNETTAFPSVATVECVIEAVNNKQLNEIPLKNRVPNNERINTRKVCDKRVNKIAMNQYKTSDVSVCRLRTAGIRILNVNKSASAR